MRIRVALGIVSAAFGIAAVVTFPSFNSAQAHDPFYPRLDTNGTCLLLSTEQASREYKEAIAEARALHPGSTEFVFAPADLSSVNKVLREGRPRFALVFILPKELDVNFAWQWLKVVTAVDDDPFVDVRTGFIVGETPTEAANFVRRIRQVVDSKKPLSGQAVDNLGPNTMAKANAFYQNNGSFFIPILAERVALTTISHGSNGFTEARLSSLDGAALIHFGGHGYPDRVVDGLSSALVRRLKLSPCVVFNGACYTGVTGQWFDMQGPLKAQEVPPEQSFCLGLLANNVIAYLAALHPDHGMPVYQEMEYMATHGACMGDLMKHTHDGVVLGAGGKLPDFPRLAGSSKRLNWTPSDIMLNGTASRVLFGDPTLILAEAFAPAPFEVKVEAQSNDALRVVAVLKNDKLKATFTDTYHADLSANPNLFNDRALITCSLPAAWTAVGKVEVVQVMNGSKKLKFRLVGYGVEEDGGQRWLHVQVDVPTSDFMQSELRKQGVQVELVVRK